MNSQYSPNMLARIALSVLFEPSNAEVYRLVRDLGAAEALRCLRRERSKLAACLQGRPGGADPYQLAKQVVEASASVGARIVGPCDTQWPHGLDDLAHLPDSCPPLCLWVRGSLDLADVAARSVTMVGARACTAYGRHVATQLSYGLGEAGWAVVSGGAYGIDEAAHRAALAAGHDTVAVMACGVDMAYPFGNARMFESIAETGLIVSEYPPGITPLRHRFLNRNRLLAALSPGTVIVEAGMRSGARHAARTAVALSRQVGAVPGPVTSAASDGVHQLMRDQPIVRTVTSASDIITDLTPSRSGREVVK